MIVLQIKQITDVSTAHPQYIYLNILIFGYNQGLVYMYMILEDVILLYLNEIYECKPGVFCLQIPCTAWQLHTAVHLTESG